MMYGLFHQRAFIPAVQAAVNIPIAITEKIACTLQRKTLGVRGERDVFKKICREIAMSQQTG